MVLRQTRTRAQYRRDTRLDNEAQRRCIASGSVFSRAALLRFVVAPDGTLVPDLSGRLPGRGLWLSPRRDMIEKACSRNLFAKAAKAPVTVPHDLSRQLVTLLRRRCLDLLGLAARAGQIAGGFEKVRGQLKAGKVGLLLQAVDGAEDGRRKLRQLAAYQDPPVSVFEVLRAEDLGKALGRQSWTHLAVMPGRIAERLEQDLTRLAGLDASGNTIGES